MTWVPKTLHDRYYESLRQLGPFCPVCKSHAEGFEVTHSPDMNTFYGKVTCIKHCRRTYHMRYDEKQSKWLLIPDMEVEKEEKEGDFTTQPEKKEKVPRPSLEAKEDSEEDSEEEVERRKKDRAQTEFF
jgi:hypothetical protein